MSKLKLKHNTILFVNKYNLLFSERMIFSSERVNLNTKCIIMYKWYIYIYLFLLKISNHY